MMDREFTGQFTTKKLTIGDITKVGVQRALLTDGYLHDPDTGKGIDLSTQNIAEMVAHCNVSLIQKPDWFIPEELIDYDVLVAVYKEVVEFEASFRERAAQRKLRRDRQKTGEIEHEEGKQPAIISADLVEKKIPKIAKI